MIPQGTYADEFRSAGGITMQDAIAQQQAEADAQRARESEAIRAYMQQQEAQRQQEQQDSYTAASADFVDWPSYQRTAQSADIPMHQAYDFYVTDLPRQFMAMGYPPDQAREEAQRFAAMVSRPDPDYGFGRNLLESLKGGMGEATAGLSAAKSMTTGNIDELARTIAAEAGGEGPVGPLKRFGEATQAEPVETFDLGGQWENIKRFIGAAWDNPEGFSNWVASTGGAMYPIIAGGFGGAAAGTAVAPGPGSLVGGIAGSFASETALETGSQIMEYIQQEARKAGVDAADPKALAAFLKTPGIYNELRNAAVAKGLTTAAGDAAINALTLRLGTIATARRGLRRAGYVAGGVATETAGGPVTELAGQAAAGRGYNYADITGELFGGPAVGGALTGLGMLAGRGRGGTQAPPGAPPGEEDLPAAGGGGQLLLPAPPAPAGLLTGPAPGAPTYQNNVAMAMGQTVDEVESKIQNLTNPLFDTLDRVSPGWRENASSSLQQPGAVDLNDGNSVREFLTARGVDLSDANAELMTLRMLVEDIVGTPDTLKAAAIANAIDEAESIDSPMAEPIGLALLELARSIPTAARAQGIIEGATVQPSTSLVDLIRRTTGQTTGAQRRTDREQWLQSFDALPRDVEAEAAHSAAITEEIRSLMSSIAAITANDQGLFGVPVAPENKGVPFRPQTAPPNTGEALWNDLRDGADVAIDNAEQRVDSKRLLALRQRAQELIEAEKDEHDRSAGSDTGEGGGRGRVDAGGNVGGTGLTPGGRSSGASAVTPSQHRFLNTLGGRGPARGTSTIGGRIASLLGIDVARVVPLISEALARRIVVEISPEGEERGTQTSIYQPTREALGGTVTPGGTLSNEPLASAEAAERRGRAESNRPIGVASRRGLRVGERVPAATNAELLAGRGGPVEAGTDTTQAAGEPGGGVPAGAAQEGTQQGRGLRRGPGDVGAATEGRAGAQSDAAARDTRLSRLKSRAARLTAQLEAARKARKPERVAQVNRMIKANRDEAQARLQELGMLEEKGNRLIPTAPRALRKEALRRGLTAQELTPAETATEAPAASFAPPQPTGAPREVLGRAYPQQEAVSVAGETRYRARTEEGPLTTEDTAARDVTRIEQGLVLEERRQQAEQAQQDRTAAQKKRDRAEKRKLKAQEEQRQKAIAELGRIADSARKLVAPEDRMDALREAYAKKYPGRDLETDSNDVFDADWSKGCE